MECPVCKTIFSVSKEILMLVDRTFYCHHCWTRLISYPDAEGKCSVENDCTGDKWMSVEKKSIAASMNVCDRPTPSLAKS